MVDVSVLPFEIETRTRPGDLVRADVYLPERRSRPVPVLLGAEISDWKLAITEAPITHWYGQKVGTDTYHHNPVHPSRLRLHERSRGEGEIL